MLASKQSRNTSRFRLIEIPRMEDSRGNLCVVDSDADFPFEIKRVFWIYGVPEGESRGKHAHHTCAEVIVPVKGKLTAHVTDGVNSADICLDNPSVALYIPEMVWCEFSDFSQDCVCLCLASESYDSQGYINDLDEFLKEVEP